MRSVPCFVFVSISIIAVVVSSPIQGPSLVGKQVSKIINGTVVESVEKYPFYVGLLKNGKELICGGALVGPNTVVSAAHCFFELAPCPGAACGPGIGPCQLKDICEEVAQDVTHVALGLLDLRDMKRAEKMPIVMAEINKKFSLKDISRGGDIAVLTLKNPVDMAQFKAIEVNEDEAFPEEGEKVRVVGFGRRTNLEYVSSRQLRELNQDIVSPDHCRAPYSEAGVNVGAAKTFLCAQKPGGLLAGVCNGDSGGPLIATRLGKSPVLVGVVSRGIGICGYPGYPDIYTKVSHYSKFVVDILNRNNMALKDSTMSSYRLVTSDGKKEDKELLHIKKYEGKTTTGGFWSRLWGRKVDTDIQPTPGVSVSVKFGKRASSTPSPSAMPVTSPRATPIPTPAASPSEPAALEVSVSPTGGPFDETPPIEPLASPSTDVAALTTTSQSTTDTGLVNTRTLKSEVDTSEVASSGVLKNAWTTMSNMISKVTKRSTTNPPTMTGTVGNVETPAEALTTSTNIPQQTLPTDERIIIAGQDLLPSENRAVRAGQDNIPTEERIMSATEQAQTVSDRTIPETPQIPMPAPLTEAMSPTSAIPSSLSNSEVITTIRQEGAAPSDTNPLSEILPADAVNPLSIPTAPRLPEEAMGPTAPLSSPQDLPSN